MTEDSRLRLQSFLEGLGKKVDMGTFEKRLLLQKMTYLAQEMGISLAFSFGWYVHGPYSPTLAKEGFELQNLVRSAGSCKIDLPKVSLDDKQIDRMRKLLDEIGREPQDIEYWLELLASAHFLHKYAYPSAKNESEIARKLEESKAGKFKAKDVKKAFGLLRKYKLYV